MNKEQLKLIYDVDEIEVNKQGSGVADRVYFTIESGAPITSELAIRIQEDSGYHPNGYGFLGYDHGRCPVTFKYRAMWYCWANCD